MCVHVWLFLLPASLRTRWNSLFSHTLTHGAGGGDVTVLATCTHGRCSATHGAGGGVMLPFWQLAHMVGVPQHLGRVG